MREDVLALPARCRGKTLLPLGRLAITGQEPRERANGRILGGPWSTRNRRLVFGLEFVRSEFSAQANPVALSDAHIPHGFSVSGYLPTKMGWARARHGVHHRTISRSSS